jgi:hypothetical protein
MFTNADMDRFERRSNPRRKIAKARRNHRVAIEHALIDAEDAQRDDMIAEMQLYAEDEAAEAAYIEHMEAQHNRAEIADRIERDHWRSVSWDSVAWAFTDNYDYIP